MLERQIRHKMAYHKRSEEEIYTNKCFEKFSWYNLKHEIRTSERKSSLDKNEKELQCVQGSYNSLPDFCCC